MICTKSKYQGALVGAVIGDCLGRKYEGFPIVTQEVVVEYINQLNIADSDVVQEYTDDTAMTFSVAQSLYNCSGFDPDDMMNRFVSEYARSPDRGYGPAIPKLFARVAVLKENSETGSSKYDVYQAAREQFDGSGSYGNGAAMRASPVGLYTATASAKECANVANSMARLTHANHLGYNGGVLLALAVRQALLTPISEGQPLDRKQFIAALITHMHDVETASMSTTYQDKLGLVEKLLSDTDVDVSEVVEQLGNYVTATKSVPTAIYLFLNSVDKPLESETSTYSPFERTLIDATALGGDTDTIASMACAISGAYYGVEAVPSRWIQICEATEKAHELAGKLYDATK